MSADLEEWRPVVDWEGLYEVSSLGRLRSLPRERLQKNRWGPCTIRYPAKIFLGVISGPRGYRRAALSNGAAKRVVVGVHVLVAAAFIGPRPQNTQVAHNNGNSLDNRKSNLRYATQQENELDKVQHGTDSRGERNSEAKVSAKDVLEIRSLRGVKTQQELANIYGIDQTTISLIQLKKLWKHI